MVGNLLLDILCLAHTVLYIYMPAFKILDFLIETFISGVSSEILRIGITLSLRASMATIGCSNTPLRQVYILQLATVLTTPYWTPTLWPSGDHGLTCYP